MAPGKNYSALSESGAASDRQQERHALVLIPLAVLVLLIFDISAFARSSALFSLCVVVYILHVRRQARVGASPVSPLEAVAVVCGEPIAAEAVVVGSDPPESTLVFTVNGKEQRVVNPSPSLLLVDYVRLPAPRPRTAAARPRRKKCRPLPTRRVSRRSTLCIPPPPRWAAA
jgi:hypothetical protein